jgi:hypothetical protein
MPRNGMTVATELFAFGFCEQVWAETGSNSAEGPLLLGRESMVAIPLMFFFPL